MLSHPIYFASRFLVLCLASLSIATDLVWAQSTVDFTRDIRPILSDRCFQCHGPDEKAREADLRLDLEATAKADLDGHRAIIPGDIASSTLVARIQSNDADQRMPPADSGKTLSAHERELLVRWVREGANWETHWSFVAPVRPKLPTVDNQMWALNPIDTFVARQLHSRGLSVSPEATREALIRRVTLDLTGLPPTVTEVEAFVRDTRPNAYELVVDRLLSSPRYGERMAVPWLDAARFSDTSGYQSDGPRQMWRWRDWVIDALNENMPFDQFTIKQLAGDLLPASTLADKIATGFNRNHRGNAEGGIIPEEYRVEYVVDRVDTTFTVWQGLTIGCARCHDHKYDPISQREYYQLYSYFNNLEEMGRVLKEGNSPPYLKAPTDQHLREHQRLTTQFRVAKRAFEKLRSEISSDQQGWENGAPVLRDGWAYPPGLNTRVSADEADTQGDYRFGDGVVGNAIRTSKGRDIQVPDRGDFGYLDKFSISLAVKPAGSLAKATLVSRMIHEPADSGYWIQVRDGHIQVNLVKRWLDDSIRVESKRKLSGNQWQHIAVTYDGSRKASGIVLYVDGEPWELNVLLDGINQSFETDGPLRIGGGTDFFDGWVDEFRLYDRALTRGEIGILATHESIGELASSDRANRSPVQAAKLTAYYLDQVASKGQRAAHSNLLQARRELAEFNEQIPTVMVMHDGPPQAAFILRRGQYDDPGERVNPGVPACLPPTRSSGTNSALKATAISNRLDLARWLTNPQNPLTARVAMNRYWELFFGRGLVRTSEDFGVQGELPSHPKLLDWLATEFVRVGWDVKAIHRMIVTSATYRQSSKSTMLQRNEDPTNALHSRGPRMRLTAEIIRDQALAASGLLVNRTGGPSVRPYQPKGLWKDIASDSEYDQATGAGLYRRSLYTYWKRTVTPPNMASFDATSREACTVSRSRTNTPLQALVLMNDPTFLDAARAVAAIAVQLDSQKERIRSAFQTFTGRTPNVREFVVLSKSIESHRAHFRENPNEVTALLSLADHLGKRDDSIELATYTVFCSMLLNLDEVMSKQ
ncbi:MAG: hypothetical protein ACI9HK_001716 [Pirellulaceae bacterium]